MRFTVALRKIFFGQPVAITAILLSFTSSALAATINYSTDDDTIEINTQSTDQHKIKADRVQMTISNEIKFIGNGTVTVQSSTPQRSDNTIIVTSGGSAIADGASAKHGILTRNTTNTTITNSGLVKSSDQYAISIGGSTNTNIINNTNGIIFSNRHAIDGVTGGTVSNFSLTNHGKIYITTNKSVINLEDESGTTITNTGEIYRETSADATSGSAQSTILLGSSSTLTNSGEIRNDASLALSSISLSGNNNTIVLKDEGIVTGIITAASGTLGNKLQLDHGFGRTYFYETSGDFDLEDLSGNAVVKGSAGSVGQGAQESIDELLGLRTYNLRSALKRYLSLSRDLIEDQLYVEPFSYYSKRGSNTSILSFEIYGYGLNFIYPLKSNKFDLIFTVEKNELELQEDHDVSNINFLAGFNARDLSILGSWKISGFFVAGVGWHDGKRRIITNTTSSGLLDVTSDYKSYEVITGGHANYSYSSAANTWDTEIGLTFSYSLTPDYRERALFTWEERQLWQGSVHIGETLTSKVNDKLTATVGGELEHRTVLAGREQSYAINGTTADSRNGQFWQNSIAAKLGANYSMNNNMIAYVNVDSRFSDRTRGTYGASVGVKLNF